MGNLECGTGSHRKHHLSRDFQRTLDKQPEREYCSPESGKAWGKHSICGLTNRLIDSDTNWRSLKMTTLWTRKVTSESIKRKGVLRQLHWIHSPFWQKATSDDLDWHLPSESYEVKNTGTSDGWLSCPVWNRLCSLHTNSSRVRQTNRHREGERKNKEE